MKDTYQQYQNAIDTFGSKRAAAAALDIPKETFRQNYYRLKEDWMNRPKTAVIIPDGHSMHGIANDRFEWAANLCQDVNADYVIDIGDWADMESLCSYDKGTKGFEGRRYKKDIASAIDARKRFKQGLGSHTLLKYACEGNHENRISKVGKHTPELDGVIDIQDLGYEEFGWNLNPLGIPYILDGIAYSHYFPSGVMNRPIGGENHAASLIKKNHMSSVCGHSHLVDYAERTRVDGCRIFGLVVGCFFEHKSDYAGHLVNNMYQRGIFVLRNIKNGFAEQEFISIDTLKKRYS